ncbi:unnamed protein product [Blepharisma stoltei]|uniref:DUF4709 domain-containing protein n=1 Tax=Blepharisma stoltei TaxID=1481888 RepID=A0AAU9JHV9_9CILI|nr:unnamed protein product [Blepharisma stoltei]
MLFMSQLADLELKVSELSAQLEAKEAEVSRLKRQFSYSFTDSDARSSTETSRRFIVPEYDFQFQYVEVENDKFKVPKINDQEIEQIKLQIQHANELRNIYENKYKEIMSLKAPTYQAKESKNKERIADLENKIEKVRTEIEEQVSISQKAKSESEYFKKDVIPVLEKTLQLYEINKQETEEQVKEMRKELGLLRKGIRKSGNESIAKIDDFESHCHHDEALIESNNAQSKKVILRSPKATTKIKKDERSLTKVKPEASASILSKITARVPRAKNYCPSYLRHRKSNNGLAVNS